MGNSGFGGRRRDREPEGGGDANGLWRHASSFDGNFGLSSSACAPDAASCARAHASAPPTAIAASAALVEKLLAALPEADADGARRCSRSRPLAAAGFVRRRLGDRFADELKKARRRRRRAARGASPPRRAAVPRHRHHRATTTLRARLHQGRRHAAHLHAARRRGAEEGRQARASSSRRSAIRRAPTRSSGRPRICRRALADGGYRTVAHDLYRSRSFLFVGFDGRDPDLAILLERVLAGARAGDVEHFAVLPGLGAVEKEELYAAYHIRVLDGRQRGGAGARAQGRGRRSDRPGAARRRRLRGLAGAARRGAGARRRARSPGRAGEEAARAGRLGEAGRADARPRRRRADAPSARAELLLEVARIFEHEVGDLSKAFTALVAAYKEHPRVEAWTELERLASATGMWSELLSELAEVMPTLPDGERAAGVAAHRAALRRQAQRGRVRAHLARRGAQARRDAGRRGRAAHRALQARRALDRAGGRRSATAGRFVEQAEVLETRIGDARAAAAAYRKALEKDPLQHEARAALEQLLRRTRRLARAGRGARRARRSTRPARRRARSRREAAELFADRLDDRKAGDRALRGARRRRRRATCGAARARAALRGRRAGRRNTSSASGGRPTRSRAIASARRSTAAWRRCGKSIPGSSARAEECLEKLLAVDPRSEDALRSLERLYYAERKWPELIDACRRHAALVPPPNARRDPLPDRRHLRARAARSRQGDRGLPRRRDGAAEPRRHDGGADPRSTRRPTQWQKAADVLERRAQLAEVKSQRRRAAPSRRRALRREAGRRQGRRETRFVRALEIDPTHVPSMTALVEIYRKNGDFLKAAKLLVEAVPHTPNRLERTRLLVEAGEIYDGLDDKRKATELYLDALAVDPEHVEAGERVAELLWKAERYTDLVPVLEMLTRKEAEPGGAGRAADAAGARGARARAQTTRCGKAYARAAELDRRTSRRSAGAPSGTRQRERAGTRRWRRSSKVFEHHVEDLPPSERVELFYELGRCELKLGRQGRGQGAASTRALELDPTHRPSLLASDGARRGQAASRSSTPRRRCWRPRERDEQAQAARRDRRLWTGEAARTATRRCRRWREALELKPRRSQAPAQVPRRVRRGEGVAAGARDARAADRDREDRTSVRAKYRHAAGLICRDELGRAGGGGAPVARRSTTTATLERSAEALEELLRRSAGVEGAGALLPQARSSGSAPSRRGDADGKNARAAARLVGARRGVPGQARRARERAGGARSGAHVRSRQPRAAQAAGRSVRAGGAGHASTSRSSSTSSSCAARRAACSSYRALKHLYIQTGQRDKSVQLLVRAAASCKKGEPDDVTQGGRATSAGRCATARRALDDESWARLPHPDEDRYLDALFALVGADDGGGAGAAAQGARPLAQGRASSTDDPRSYAKALKLRGDDASTWRCPRPTCGPSSASRSCSPTASTARRWCRCSRSASRSSATSGSEREQVFELARALAHLRPERFMRWRPAAAGSSSAHVIEAAMALGDEADGKPPADRRDRQDRAGPQARAAAACSSSRWRPSAASCAPTARSPRRRRCSWLQATDLTGAARRLGDGRRSRDLRALAAAAEPQPATALPATQRLLDLVWSSVTEELFAVRKHLGMM